MSFSRRASDNTGVDTGLVLRATVSNVTYQETDPAITFNGTWGNNTGPFFSGGGTTFTNEDGASFSFSFHGTPSHPTCLSLADKSLTTGSTVYVFGDKKNDHGTYGVVLDNQPAQLLDGVSGCGGAFGQTCEEQIPSIKYLASNLDDSLHTITLVNHAGVNNSFFGMLPLPCPVNLIQYLTYSFD